MSEKKPDIFEVLEKQAANLADQLEAERLNTINAALSKFAELNGLKFIPLSLEEVRGHS